MDNLSKRYRIARLIVRQIIEGADAPMDKELEEWLAESEDNQREYEDIRRRLREDLRQKEESLAPAAWKKTERRLPKRRTLRRIAQWAAAACVIFAMGTGAFLWMQAEEELPATVSTNTKSYQAVLILGDGERVTLNDSTRQFITEKAGTRISTEGNTVRYEAQEESETTEMHTLLIPRGGEFHMELADGTQVWLNSESKLTYPARFTGGTREVAMEGEVCFQVAKNEAQPFIVRTGGMAVTVLGTVFNVDAYPDNGRIATTLVEGKVEIQAGDEKQTLLPDQQAVLEKGKGIEVKKVYAEDYISWIGGVFHFTEASLEEIMQKLSRWYNFEFFFANADVKDAHFTLNIRRYENVSDILSKIEKTGRAHFNINGRTVVVSE